MTSTPANSLISCLWDMICPINNAKKKLLLYMVTWQPKFFFVLMPLIYYFILLSLTEKKKKLETLYEYIIKACWLDHSIHHTQQEKVSVENKDRKIMRCVSLQTKQIRVGDYNLIFHLNWVAVKDGYNLWKFVIIWEMKRYEAVIRDVARYFWG